MKKILFVLSILLFSASAFSQSATAKGAVTAALNKGTLSDAVSYLEKTVAAMSSESEKRAVITFLAQIEEQNGKYSEAQKHYAQAAGMKGSVQSGAGVPVKTSEQLVLSAARCALNAGDYASAQNYLNSSVRNSKDSVIQSTLKLYEQWCALCRASSVSETQEAVAMLKAYSTLDSMKSVMPSVLLTLWHLTGDKTYSDRLKASFPKSPEAAVVKGQIQVLPTPYWYFVPRNGSDIPDIEIDKTVAAETPKKGGESPKTEQTSSSSEKITKQQLGLFKGKENAQALADKVKARGFEPKIESEVRPSGTTYYIVVVPENKAGTIGKELKTAGFECYPVFE